MSAPTGNPGPRDPQGPYGQPGQAQHIPSPPLQSQAIPPQAFQPQPIPPQAFQPPFPYAPAAPAPWSAAGQPPPGAPLPAFSPPPVAPRSSRPLIVVAVALGLAVVLAGSYLVGRLTAPMAAPSASPVPATAAAAPTAASASASNRVGFTLTGSTLSGPTFTARMPSGWTVGSDNGLSNNDGEIEQGTNNSLAYFASNPTSATTRCNNAMGNYSAKLGGAVVDLPSVPWADATAIVKELETKYSTGQAIGLDIYCVDRPGNTSAAILSVADPQHQATNKAAAEALLASWVWK